jgi:hypothetical protein
MTFQHGARTHLTVRGNYLSPAAKHNFPSYLTPVRLYPPTLKGLNFQIPQSIRDSFREAQGCFQASLFTATVVMCRRVIEEVIRQQGIKSKGLYVGLRDLRDKDLIDARLFEWADLLRLIGNEAAHGVGEKIAPQDAEDVLHFTEALADYIYVLKSRFEELQNRRGHSRKETIRSIESS